MVYNSFADNAGLSSFVQLFLPPKSVKSREIPHKFEIIAVQGHRVSIKSTYATSY